MSSGAQVDYYFSLVSPFAYLGHAAFLDLAHRHHATVAYRPVRPLEVFAAAGGVPLGQRAPSRQRYRLLELQRWRQARGLPLNLHPAFFPVDGSLADCAVAALTQLQRDPDTYIRGAFRAVWVDERNLADRQVIADLLAKAGHDAGAVLALASSESVQAAYRANTEAAAAADLPGVPGYVLAGEAFWGQDRLEMLGQALQSARPPYRGD
ncbi:DsbA family protein [Pseudoxanthomonas wuyuanensis]